MLPLCVEYNMHVDAVNCRSATTTMTMTTMMCVLVGPTSTAAAAAIRRLLWASCAADNMALISRWKHVASERARAVTVDLLARPSRRRRRRRRRRGRPASLSRRARHTTHVLTNPPIFYSLPLLVAHKLYRE